MLVKWSGCIVVNPLLINSIRKIEDSKLLENFQLYVGPQISKPHVF